VELGGSMVIRYATGVAGRAKAVHGVRMNGVDGVNGLNGCMGERVLGEWGVRAR